MILAPPVEAGAVNATLADVPLATAAAPIVGAPGAMGATVKDSVTCGAAEVLELPTWLALMVHVPAVMNVNTPPLVIAQTPVVDDVNATVNAELDVAVSVGVVPKFFVPGFANAIDCEPKPVTDPDAPEALLVPALLVAVTVKVYAVPLVRPVTTIGLDEPEAVNPPGLEVTV